MKRRILRGIDAVVFGVTDAWNGAYPIPQVFCGCVLGIAAAIGICILIVWG